MIKLTKEEYYKLIIENKQNYLTENILEYYLNYLFYDYEIIRDKIVPNSKIKNRPDFRIEDLKLIIEFDGDSHFTSSYTILNDISKDNIYNSMGYTIIRIPYWIQLNDSVLWGLFNEYLSKEWNFYENIASNYPLGFIDKKAKLPADYSELDLHRYYELYKFYNNIVDKFYKYHDFTLYNKCFEYNSLFRVYNLSKLTNLDNICYMYDDTALFHSYCEISKYKYPGIFREIKMLKNLN